MVAGSEPSETASPDILMRQEVEIRDISSPQTTGFVVDVPESNRIFPQKVGRVIVITERSRPKAPVFGHSI